MDLVGQLDNVQTREDIAAFVRTLRENLLEGGHADEWENPTLERYLAALATWVDDMDGYFQNRGETVPDQPSWNLIGQILYAARSYE